MATYHKALLTDADLVELTGVSQAARQIKHLQKYGIPFVRRGDGKPRTTWGIVEQALSGGSVNRPDFSKVR